MKRPLFLYFVIFIFGILLVSLTDSFFVVGATFFMLCAVSFGIYAKNKSIAYLGFPLFFIVGVILSITSAHPTNSDIDQIAQHGEHVTIEGVVHDAIINQSGTQVLTIFTDTIISDDYTYYERLQIRIVSRGEAAEQIITAGSRLRVVGSLHTLQSARNPGGFSELNHLGARGYDYTIRVDSWHVLEAGINTRSVLRELRDRVISVYYASLPDDKAGILAAMVTGERSGITDYVRNLYRDSGIFHVLVVSGMHISILGLFVERVLRQVITAKAAATIAIGFLVIYCIFTGASTSTVRAVIMASVLVLAKLFQKEPDVVSSASFAGLVMLFYEPRWLFDIGFQYSFAAVLGLGFFARPTMDYLSEITGRQKGLKLRILQGFTSSLIVFVVTMPIQIYHFNQVVTYSVFANLLVVPLLSLILIPGFIMGIVGLFSVELAMVFSGVIYFLLAFYEQLGLFISGLPHAQILVATPHYLWTFAFVGLLAGGWYLFASEASRELKLRLMGATLGVYLISFGIYSALPNAPIMIKLDVGQGDAVVIERYGEVFVIDAGGWSFREVGQSTGARIVAPYLEHRGISHIDAIFVSHLHRDHAFGVIELMEIVNVDRIYFSTRIDKGYPIWTLLEEAAAYNDVEIRFLQAGDYFRSSGGISFLVLSPSDDHRYPNTNEASKVMYLDIDGLRVMFTGDIGTDTERLIAQRFSHLRTDILKVAHHGSRFSTGDLFLDAANPSAAIAGVGVHNPFNHPHPTVVDRFLERGIDFYSTHTHGAITIDLRTHEITTMLGDNR